MRAIIAKPMYRALKTLAERKQAFHDYVDDLRMKEEVSYNIQKINTVYAYVFDNLSYIYRKKKE